MEAEDYSNSGAAEVFGSGSWGRRAQARIFLRYWPGVQSIRWEKALEKRPGLLKPESAATCVMENWSCPSRERLWEIR